MERCSVIGAECEYHPEPCPGCDAVGAKPFWTVFTGQARCGIYQCCALEQKLPHCGSCPELPCVRYGLKNPTKSVEENVAEQQIRLKRLREN